ncbi:MAG TPA: hypothetical protein DIU00_24110 [Phycisphaerales bacterium]|nr:hypothetical protein [Phycisphaerales bacterium]
MNDNERQFEDFVSKIKFDDTPDSDHRDKLEQDLLAAMAKQTRQEKDLRLIIWRRIMKSPIVRLTAAAVIIVGILVGIGTFSCTTAWAQITRAVNDVQNIHITETVTHGNADVREYQWWIKKPRYLKEEYTDRVIIDNGIDRLVINKAKKTAQLSDSWLPYRPLEKHYMFGTLGFFREKKPRGTEITKIAEQSDEIAIVYEIEKKDYKGKAWIEANTMLPLRIVATTAEEPKADEPISLEYTYNYEPISMETFSTSIPPGYDELPRKQREVLSGKLINKRGQVVPGATVYAVDGGAKFAASCKTDRWGEFSFKLPPDNVEPLWFPIFLRAFQEDDPSRVAWTIIRGPNEKRESGIKVPGNPGHHKILEGRGSVRFAGATGIVLETQPAGKIVGQVTDIDGNAISDAAISVTCHPVDKFGNEGDHGLEIGNLGGPGKYGAVTTQTDGEGRYEFDNLPRFWDKTVFIVGTGAQGYVYSSIRFRSEGPMNYKEVDFLLYPAGLTVKGVVMDNYGAPLAQREIYALVNGKDYTKCKTKTDEKGGFRLFGCPISQDLQIKADLSHNHWPPHERKRYLSYRYYPDVVVDIEYEEGNTEYEVEMVAERPESTIEVELKNTAGEPLPYFPVEVRGAPGTISSQWEADKKLKQRTDKNGYCKFTEVPKVEDLRLVMWGSGGVWNETLSEEQVEKIKKKYKKYKWTEVPIELIPDQKEYKIEVTILTNEEYEQKK